jgi:hypothetical protein
MKTSILVAAFATSVAAGTSARAALTASETEEVRGYVATDSHADRLRALVARPDLSGDESAAAMTAALTGTAIDERRSAFLGEVVSGAPSAAARPLLAVAVVRGLLARAEALYLQHAANLERAADLADIARVYAFAAAQIAAGDDTARAAIARALGDHVSRNSAVLALDAPVPSPVARVRAQAALALYDALPDGPTRRVDAADKLRLAGARRAALTGLGVLVLDAGAAEGRVAELRAILERLPGAREGLAAIFVGDAHAAFRARGAVVSTDGAPDGPLSSAASPWSEEAAPPSVEASTVAFARGLALAAVRNAVQRRPSLRGAIDSIGETAVATVAAMLAVDAPRTMQVAAARWLAGKRESLAALAVALGSLAVFAPASAPTDGLSVALGQARATHIALDPSGVATALRLDGHLWRIDRDGGGAVTGLRRDGATVVASMLPEARPPATESASWSGSGIVFARLSGAPRMAIASGPRIRLVGSTARDAVSTPGPGPDIAVEADVRVDGGPAGVVVRAVPGTVGYKGVSLLLMPGAPLRAVLLVADGYGVEMAATPVAEVVSPMPLHVRMVTRGNRVEAQIGPGGPLLSAMVPDDFAHGDVALRAYPGAMLEATSWRTQRVRTDGKVGTVAKP